MRHVSPIVNRYFYIFIKTFLGVIPATSERAAKPHKKRDLRLFQS